MATVTLEEFKGTQSVQLDAAQTRMFEDELRRVRGGWLSRFFTNLFTSSTRQYLTAPDCLIKVDKGGRVTEYELYSGYILRKKGEKSVYTFYMGLLLLQWLYGPSP